MSSSAAPHNPERYRGKNLAYLLLALCAPAAFLFLRIVLALTAADNRVTTRQAHWLSNFSYVALVLFFLAQAASAGYLQRLLAPSRSFFGRLLQYCLALVFGLLFSIAGAIMLEAFGLNVFLRFAGQR